MECSHVGLLQCGTVRTAMLAGCSRASYSAGGVVRVEQLVVEALAVAVLPWASGIDVGGLGFDVRDPLTLCGSDDLRALTRWSVGPQFPQ